MILLPQPPKCWDFELTQLTIQTIVTLSKMSALVECFLSTLNINTETEGLKFMYFRLTLGVLKSLYAWPNC